MFAQQNKNAWHAECVKNILCWHIHATAIKGRMAAAAGE
jgi:hypothetical protein